MMSELWRVRAHSQLKQAFVVHIWLAVGQAPICTASAAQLARSMPWQDNNIVAVWVAPMTEWRLTWLGDPNRGERECCKRCYAIVDNRTYTLIEEI